MFEHANERLTDRGWLAGCRNVADPCFYITLRWADRSGAGMTGLEHTAAFSARMEADPGVQAAPATEGLA